MADSSGCFYEEDRGYGIHTWSGKAFFPKDIRPEDVSIEDIAHGLAMTCRYGGQCDYFYSVAQHSVHCYEMAIHMADREYWREALLHDAVEAYLGADFPRPYKVMIPALSEFEQMIERQLNPILGLPVKKSDIVRFIDETMLATEMPLLFQKHGTYVSDGKGWFTHMGDNDIMGGLPKHLPWDRIESWSPEMAEERFLGAYEEMVKLENAA